MFGLLSVATMAFHAAVYMSSIGWDWNAVWIPQRIGLSVLDGIGVSAPASLVLCVVSALLASEVARRSTDS